jgi:hypothetical protein
MSINSLALVGVLRPSLLTRSRQVVGEERPDDIRVGDVGQLGALLRKLPAVLSQGFP